MFAVSLLFVAHGGDALPVHRIRFYETGVAWFEREGLVTDATSLPVPTSHLDDALKTLVVLGGDVDLGAITFPSAIGDDAARVEAGLDGSANLTFADTLAALTGVEVTLETAERSIHGVLVDVSGPLEVVKPTETGQLSAVAEEYALTLLDRDGHLHRTTTREMTSLRSEEAEVTERLSTAARTLARTRAQRPNALDVQLAKGGRLGLGYLAEAPVWRVSYRVLDPGSGHADLQAWALVHNDTDEAWKDVQVELANGEPDSFLFPLAAPRYAERELRTPDRDLATVSQLAATTPDEMWNEASRGSYGMGLSGTGMGGGGSAYGVAGTGTFGTSTAATLKTAEPVETPTQFVYRVATPVDLPAHHSALVPILQEGVPAEPAVVFEPGSTRARSGMWLANGTDRTLPAGVVSVIQAGGLAGESRLERLKPDETQMVQFGNELDVDLDRHQSVGERDLESLVLRRDQLVLHSSQHTTLGFGVRNRSGRSRELWIALTLSPAETVKGELRTEIDRQTGWTWVVLPTDAGTTDQLVRTVRKRVETIQPDSVEPAEFRAWAEAGLADASVMERAARIAQDIADIDAQRYAISASKDRVNAELTGLRASLAAAEGSDAAQPLTKRAASVESELRELDEDDAELSEKRKARAADLLAALQPLAEADASADAG